MNTPIISTFASSEDALQTAISAGADHVILDDSKISIRSYSNDFETSGFQKLIHLATLAKKINPEVQLSVNCDMMMHHDDFSKVSDLLNSIKESPITYIRIQDPGLIPFIKRHSDLDIQIATETGNHNQKSIATYASLVNAQCLNIEIPKDELKSITKAVDCKFEIQVQGPILIQNSPRRFMAGKDSPKSSDIDRKTMAPISKLAQDRQYPHRYFPFYDNPHGHFMYLYFDRCLIKSIAELMDISLNSWLIDARGESNDYLQTCIETYVGERNRYLKKPDTYSYDPNTLKKIEEASQRPQKPGFFHANKTDQLRLKKGALQDGEIEVGRVIDIVKGSNISVRVKRGFNAGDELIMRTPEGKTRQVDTMFIRDIWGHSLTSAEGNSIVTLPWTKGSQTKAIIFKPPQ